MATAPKTIDDTEYKLYSAISRGLDHEANVINHRIMWSILYSAGLFTASAILFNILFRNENNAIESLIYLVMSIVSITGIIFSRSVEHGVAAAHSQFDYLREKYDALKKDFNSILPRPFGERRDHQSGNAVSRVFPRIMFISWLCAFILEFSLAVLFCLVNFVDVLKPLANSLNPTALS